MKRLILVLACLLAGVPGPVFPSEDVLIDEQGLVLNGRGTRQVMFIDLYTCELYVAERTRNRSVILELGSPVRVVLQVHGDPPAKLPADWRDILHEELTDQMFRRARSEYRELKAGDRVELSYRPGEGTGIRINDEQLLTDPGDDLIRAVLEQWLGDQPVSTRLKEELLGESM